MPKQRSKLARMEPRMAAWMTGMRFPGERSRTMNSTISTTELRVVSSKTPSILGSFLANSPPAKPKRFADGTMAIEGMSVRDSKMTIGTSHTNIVEGEHPDMFLGTGKMHGNGGWHKGP